MLVTVITPSKNQGAFIEHCLRSVHMQTHGEIEHIILDGMSSDETANVAARYPCTFIQRADSGPAQAINRGLDMAKGDVVCWLNADDAFFSSTTLERVIRIFSEQPEIDMVTGDGYYIDEQGRYLNAIVPVRPGRVCQKWIRRADYILQPATFWRRNQLRLDERLRYCFDWQLWIDSFNSGLNVLYSPQYFALYRIQPDSLTQQDNARRKHEIFRMVRKHSNPAQASWCWAIWRGYQVAELTHWPGLKELISFADKIMDRASHGLICSC